MSWRGPGLDGQDGEGMDGVDREEQMERREKEAMKDGEHSFRDRGRGGGGAALGRAWKKGSQRPFL